jgi:hypothetical protein
MLCAQLLSTAAAAYARAVETCAVHLCGACYVVGSAALLAALQIAAGVNVAWLDGGVWADLWRSEHCTARCAAFTACCTVHSWLFALQLKSMSSPIGTWLELPAGLAVRS